MSLPASAPASECMRVQDYDSQMLVAKVRAWSEGKCVGTVTSISSQNRHGKWQLACLLTKPRRDSKRIYSDCDFESEASSTLSPEFNQWVNAKSIKSRVTTEDLVTGQDIFDRMELGIHADGGGAVTVPPVEKSVLHGALKSAGVQPASDFLVDLVAPAADGGAGAARVWAEMEQPAASHVAFWRLVGAGVGGATFSTATFGARNSWRFPTKKLSSF